MALLRVFLMRHRRLAALLVAMALCIKALVPTGYMVDSAGSVLTVRLCDGQNVTTMQIAVPGKDASSHDGHGADHGQDANHCPFGALSMNALGGADAFLLSLQLAFILLLGFAPLAPPALRRIPYQTPPLRGPPAHA